LYALQQSLKEIMEFGVPPNPAMSRIIFDYSNYHAIMVMMSGFLLLMFSFLSFKCWTKFKTTSSIRWTFEKKSYFYFLIISVIMALFMLLLVVANTSNTLDPQTGLSLTYEQTSPDVSAYSDELNLTFNNWIESSDSSIPPTIYSEIENRVNFHTNKALKSFALLIVFMVLSLKIWKKVLNRSKTINSSLRIINWNLCDKINFAIGNASIALSLLLLIMVIANIQGAFAPLTAFLVGFL
jgi:hypothetical protein